MREKLNALLEKLGPIYETSDIKKEGWSYSLVNTSMEHSAPLIFGFNWGVAQNEKYLSQQTIEKTNFEAADVGSLKRIHPFIRQHFGQDYLSKVSQLNYCFF